jgi:hypothetical protein
MITSEIDIENSNGIMYNDKMGYNNLSISISNFINILNGLKINSRNFGIGNRYEY